MKNATTKTDAENTLDQAADTVGLCLDNLEDDLPDLLNEAGIELTAEGGEYRLDTTLLTVEKLMEHPGVKASLEAFLNNVIGAYQMAVDNQDEE